MSLAAITVAPHAIPAATAAVCDAHVRAYNLLRVVALLQVRAPQVDGSAGPVVAVAGELAHDYGTSGSFDLPRSLKFPKLLRPFRLNPLRSDERPVAHHKRDSAIVLDCRMVPLDPIYAHSGRCHSRGGLIGLAGALMISPQSFRSRLRELVQFSCGHPGVSGGRK